MEKRSEVRNLLSTQTPLVNTVICVLREGGKEHSGCSIPSKPRLLSRVISSNKRAQHVAEGQVLDWRQPSLGPVFSRHVFICPWRVHPMNPHYNMSWQQHWFRLSSWPVAISMVMKIIFFLWLFDNCQLSLLEKWAARRQCTLQQCYSSEVTVCRSSQFYNKLKQKVNFLEKENALQKYFFSYQYVI